MNKTTKKKAGILLLVAALLATGMQVDVTSTTETEKIAAATDASTSNNSDTLIISNITEFKSFAEDVCAGNKYKGKTVKLANDLVYDGSTVNNFTPIGRDLGDFSYGFAGTFDGCGYSIRGVIVNNSQSGLFGCVDGGTIQNLTIESSQFARTYSNNGGIVAYMKKGNIYNCKVVGCKIEGGSTVAGIVGYMSDGNIDNCKVIECKIDSEGSAGGIAGASDASSIVNCMVSGTINSSYSEATARPNEKYGTGGIVGYVRHTNKVLNCCNFADLNVKNSGGGIVGFIYDNGYNYIRNCHNVGRIVAVNSGGIVASGGYNTSTGISNCYVLEGTADKLGVTAMGNKIMTAEEMQSQVFLDNLNEMAKSNGWVEWEMQSGYSYPVLKDTVINLLNTTAEPSSSPEPTQQPATTPAPSGSNANVMKITLYVGGNKNTTMLRVGTSIRSLISDNKNAVEVSSNGKLCAKKKGTANIYASLIDPGTGVEKRYLLATVTVKNANLKIKNISPTIKPGTSILLKVKKQGVQGAVKWKSSRPTVATINRKGLLKTKKQGVAVISVSCGGKVKKYKIRVTK